MGPAWQPPPGPSLVLGLGNPGKRYAGTRHNLGAMAAEELARRHDIKLGRKSLSSLWGKGIVKGRKVVVALPQTYMNLSGQAASQLLDYFDLGAENLLAVHDDLDLELGRLKIAVRGSSGGHKGIASLIHSLETDRLVRLKLGIGRPRYQEEIDRYVLSGFYADQQQAVERVTMAAVDCLEVMLTQGPQAAMQKFHRPTNEEVEG